MSERFVLLVIALVAIVCATFLVDRNPTLFRGPSLEVCQER